MEKRKVHFMGLGGAGISAVAAFAQKAGFEISGCDIDESSPFLKNLRDNQVTFSLGHDKDHVQNTDMLVISPAIESLDPDNLELFEAKKANIPVLIGEEFLAKYLIGDKKVIAVSGTHGKSTTTAMIGKILTDAGLDPSVLVGAIVKDWGTNFRIGQGNYFVLEADEYQKKFLLYSPFISVVTALEMDHPEYFKDIEDVFEAFKSFVAKTNPEGRVVLGRAARLETPNAKVLGKHFKIETLDLKLIGEFNLENASLAFEVGKILRIDDKLIKNSLENFSGIARRFDFKGEVNKIKVFDDYGHHPTAIKATIKAAKEKFPNSRVYLVYQPHMFTRTKMLFDEFVNVFKNLGIEKTILVDIYAARQENKENISSLDIVKAVDQENVVYFGDFETAVKNLTENLMQEDVVIVMGAGDIYKLSDQLLIKLHNP